MVFFGTLTVFTWIAFLVFVVRLALTRKAQVSRQDAVVRGKESESDSFNSDESDSESSSD